MHMDISIPSSLFYADDHVNISRAFAISHALMEFLVVPMQLHDYVAKFSPLSHLGGSNGVQVRVKLRFWVLQKKRVKMKFKYFVIFVLQAIRDPS